MTDKSAIIFCIGRELLEGLALDRNANFIAARLSSAGLRVRTIQVLDDVEDDMVEAFKHALLQRTPLVFTTGGMGPGNADITRQCVAKAAGLPLGADKQALEMLQRAYRRLKAKGIVEDDAINDTRARMAQVPKGSTCYENPIGTAPAVSLQSGATTFYLLPGTSEEMQSIFVQHVMPILSRHTVGQKRKSRVVEYPNRDESALTQLLHELSKRFPDVAAHSQTTGSGEGLRIRITLTGQDADERVLDQHLDRAEADLRSRLGLDTGAR